MNAPAALTGGCACGAVRYRLTAAPMFVNCCHCTDCQTESGSAFALNALIETRHVAPLAAAPEPVATPSVSGKGQTILRCPTCRVALWSHYAGAGAAIAFVRAGTLDDPGAVTPDIHIYTRSKQPWVTLPAGAPAVDGYYDARAVWPADAQARWKAAMAV